MSNMGYDPKCSDDPQFYGTKTKTKRTGIIH